MKYKISEKGREIRRKNARKNGLFGKTPRCREKHRVGPRRSIEKGFGPYCESCGFSTDGGILFHDHNHATGKARGLLCRECNTGIGFFRDNIEFLQKAIEYLKRYS